MAHVLKNVVALGDDTASNGKQPPNPDAWNALIEKLGLNGFTKSTLDHNRFTSLGIVLAVALLALVKGLQPTAPDPFYPGQRATVATIKSEHDQLVTDQKNQVQQMQVKVQNAQGQIQQENQQLAAVLSAIGTAAAPFAGPFAPVVLGAVGLAVTGLGADTLRKSTQATQSSNTANSQASANSSNGSQNNQNDVVTSADQIVQALVSALNKGK